MDKQLINLNPIDLKTVECEKCKAVFFTRVTIYKLVPRFYTKSGKDEEFPFDLRRCVACGHVQGIDNFLKPSEATANVLANPSPERIELSAKSNPLI